MLGELLAGIGSEVITSLLHAALDTYSHLNGENQGDCSKHVQCVTPSVEAVLLMRRVGGGGPPNISPNPCLIVVPLQLLTPQFAAVLWIVPTCRKYPPYIASK